MYFHSKQTKLALDVKNVLMLQLFKLNYFNLEKILIILILNIFHL